MPESQGNRDNPFEAMMNITNPAYAPNLDPYYPTGYPFSTIPPHQGAFEERSHALRAVSLDSGSSPSDMDEKNAPTAAEDRSKRSRRRTQSGVQSIKHRRTRSGCYTCRQRRIKCDENRPTCDRCRKGNRECNYPGGPTTTSKRSPDAQSKSSSNGDDSDQSETELDDPATNPPEIGSVNDSATVIDGMNTPSVRTTETTHHSSPVSDGTITSLTTTTTSMSSGFSSKPYAFRQDSHQPLESGMILSNRWLALPADVRLLLTYHRDSLSHHHYAFRHDRTAFLKTTFLDFAINDESEALLYAVVAFASYQYTLACGETALSTFLSYYDKSIVLLQQSLNHKRPDLSTLLTILQLATIEECLGDWTNMFGHQRAAHQILTELFTPQTIVLDATRLQIIQWYMRFDIFHALLTRREVCLSREWFDTCRDHYSQQAQSGSRGLSTKVEDLCATLQLLGGDLSALISNAPVDSSTTARPNREQLVEQFDHYREELEATISSASELERNHTQRALSLDSTSQSIAQATSLKTERLCLNSLKLDFLALDLMMKHHVQRQDPTQLAAVALKIVSMLDGMERNTDEPPSAILDCRGSLIVASHYLPSDAKYTNWARRRLATIEQLGCVYPVPLRKRILGQWGVNGDEMWLPDNECTSPILESVRDFIEYRASAQTDGLDTPFRDANGL